MVLIINADDFGLNGRINRAVLRSFEKKLCSSATLMPNMPGFEEACQIARENKLLNHIGMHLVLSDGPPLTEKIRRLPELCDREGRLCLARTGTLPILRLGSREQEAVAEEIRAQIKRCRSHGIHITHIDSHAHIHADWGVAAVLIPVAREQGVPSVRLARNCGPGINLLMKMYKYIFNYRLRYSGLARTEYFGDIMDFIFLKNRGVSLNTLGSFEVMIHPGINDGQALVDRTHNLPLEDVVQRIDGYADAVSFNGAAVSNITSGL